jgi:signal transduction histidine kinase
MQLMLYLPSILLAIIQLFLGVLLLRVHSKTQQKGQTAQFVLITFSLTAWTVVNTLLLVENTDTFGIATLDTLNSLGFFLGALSLVLIYNFSFYFPVYEEKTVLQRWSYYVLLLVTPVTMLQPFTGYHYISDGNLSYVFGNLRYLYVLFVVFVMAVFIVRMYRSLAGRRTRIGQIKTMIIGLTLTFVHGLIFILVLPPLTNDSNIYYAIGYLAPLYFVISTSYGLVKQELFDFKSVALRGAVYLLSVGSLVLAYVIAGFFISSVLLDRSPSIVESVVNGVLVLLLLTFYKPLRSIFDVVTARLFYQDKYDSQQLIDELNESLVTDVDVESLLHKTSQIIQSNFKSSDCAFYIRETSYFPSRFISLKQNKLSFSDQEKIRQVIPSINSKVFSVFKEPVNNEERILSDVLKKNELEVFGKLVSTNEYKVAGVGYFVLGPKKNGSNYTSEDLRIIETISNELVLAVENALRLEEIEQFNVTLQKKIDAATKELKDSNQKLKALDEAKDEFVSMASHQLRTPLTSIKGYISMVLEEDAGEINETQKKMLGQAFFSSQRMVYLISDLLNVSRLKTGKFLIEPKPVNLADIVDSELAQLQEGAGAKNQTLSFTKPKNFPILNLDDMKLRQVIMNFTDNAIYYTPAGGKITIDLKDTGKSVEFTVKDSGIGVPKKEQHKLFAKFYRAENARKARPDGTGLGLFMAKKVIVAQGGAIIFTSKEGKGSTFGFSFPKDKVEVKETED